MKDLRDFFRDGHWSFSGTPKPIHHFLLNCSRILLSSIRGFNRDQCFLKASALTYYSLLSIVPVLAVGFGIARGFGFEHKLEEELLYQFKENPEIANKTILFAYTLLTQVKGGLIAGIGAVTLFYTVFRLLGYIETSFNDIWKVIRERTLARKMTDYFAMMLLLPFFFAAASSVTIFITTQMVKAARGYNFFDYVSPFISFLFYFFPYVFAWILFSFVYIFMPNTKVSWKSGVLAGVVAGTVYQILQWVYIVFQIGVSSYGAIYGSFAALPLFLLWVNMSWIVVLAGAEIAYHSEYNYDVTIDDPSRNRSKVSQKTLAIFFIRECLLNLATGSPSLTLEQAAKKMNVNLRIVREVAEDLAECELLTRSVNDQGQELYLPAVNIHNMTIKNIGDALDSLKEKFYYVNVGTSIKNIQGLINKFDKEATLLSSNIELGDAESDKSK